MPRFCAAYGCVNSSDKEECKEKNVSFHRFPMKQPERVKQWLARVKRADFMPNEHSVLCSEHFEMEDFDNLPYSKRNLKKDAVPSIFSYRKEGTKRKRLACQFGFPKEEKCRDLWIGAVRRESSKPSKKTTKVRVKKDLKKKISSAISSNEDIENEGPEKEISAISEQNDNLIETDSIPSDIESESCDNVSEKYIKVCSENESLKAQLSDALDEKKKHIEKINLLEQACLLQQFEVESLNNLIEELKKS